MEIVDSVQSNHKFNHTNSNSSSKTFETPVEKNQNGIIPSQKLDSFQNGIRPIPEISISHYADEATWKPKKVADSNENPRAFHPSTDSMNEFSSNKSYVTAVEDVEELNSSAADLTKGTFSCTYESPETPGHKDLFKTIESPRNDNSTSEDSDVTNFVSYGQQIYNGAKTACNNYSNYDEDNLISPGETPPMIDATPLKENVMKGNPTIFVNSATKETTSANSLTKIDFTLEGNSLLTNTKDSSDPTIESDEDYFEEFHLPNTHENAFVRHVSFRRKVQTTPINAPDADRIEGLVRTGEFIRHGSIRKRIVPEEELEELEYEEEESEDENEEESSFSNRIERDLREIERYLSEENLNVSYTDGIAHSQPYVAPRTKKKAKRTASTPKNKNADKSAIPVEEMRGEIVISEDGDEKFFEESLSIEDSTIRKIRDCLDFSSYKDLLNLTGRLSDILSPKEVEEILSHSERYRQYLDSEVIEALSLSIQGQSQSLPFIVESNLAKSNFGSSSYNNNNQITNNKVEAPFTQSEDHNKSIHNIDSGFSSPKSPKEEIDKPIDETRISEQTPATYEVFGSENKSPEKMTSTLRKIPAPKIHLDSSSEIKTDEEEESFDIHVEDFKCDFPVPKKKISVTDGILDISDISEGRDNISVASEAMEKDENRTAATSNMESPTKKVLHLPEEIPPPLEYFSAPTDFIPEMPSTEEQCDLRHWRNVVIGGAWRRIDMKVIAPYRKCITHCGCMESSNSPIVVLSSSLLPQKSRRDYNYVMDNLFMYVLSFLEQLVADDYILVYLAGGGQTVSGPGFHWMRKAYDMIDRRLRKNLNTLLIVHPSLWARTLMTLSRPFISSKFYRKVQFVYNLTELAQLVPLDQLEIPDVVKQADFEIMIKEKKNMKAKR